MNRNEALKQLKDLREHCEFLSEKPEIVVQDIDIQPADVEALDYAIAMIEGKQ